MSTAGAIAGWEFAAVDTVLFPHGGAEQDPRAWWNAFLCVAKKLIGQRLVAPRQIAAICCSTQGECTVPVAADGEPLMNAVLWMDSRGAADLKRITGGPIRVAGYHALRLWRWIRLTGGAPSLSGKDPAAHMLWVKYAHPDIYEKTYKFLNALDYLNLRLTGRCVATADSILTSWVTDNRDSSNVVYSPALLRRCDIAPDKFPEIVKCTDVIGTLRREVAMELGLSGDVAVVAGAIDNTAAAVGSGAVRDYATHLYIGTSSWLAAHVPFKKTDIVSSLASVPCAIPGRYLLTALQATAGGNLTFLRDKILYHHDELLQEEGVPDVYQIMDRIAARTPAGSNGVIYTPWIYGERAPAEDSTVRAAIYNLSLHNSRADIIRAVLEGVAFNTRWLLRPFERFLGRSVDAINIVGGGANSNVWCQIFADVLNRPVRQVKDPIQANVRGAAFIAAVGLDCTSFHDIPERTDIRHVYQPNPAHRALYDALSREFVNIYRHNKRIYRRLNSARPRVVRTAPPGVHS